MTRVRVWAPRVTTLDIEVAGQPEPMIPDRARPGWWESTRELAHGTDYLLVVDGDRLPDPSARWAPHGVHGPSRVLDTETFRWGDASWPGLRLGPHSLIYELHVGTFTPEGTLSAAAQRLAYLADLGVSHVELLPLAAFDGDRGWGYDGVLINAVHPAYGEPADLAAFVDVAHRTGLAVILDVVHNHLGPSGNYWDRFGPFFTDEHHTPWGSAVNLDRAGSDDVRRILLDSAAAWLRDFHLDGLRLDAVHELHDTSATPFLEQLTLETDALSRLLHRPLTLVAESDRNDPRTVTEREDGGLGLHAQWDDDVHHALHWLLTGEDNGYYADFASGEALTYTLSNTFLHDGRFSTFRGRTHGRPVDPAQTPPERFVVALQTHDQVGNRAGGERLSQLVPLGRAAAGAALLFALPYVPMIFMGEEWAAQTPWLFFSGFEDEDLGRSVTEGRRREFAAHDGDEAEVPDPQDRTTFHASVLDWSEVGSDDGARMLSWYRQLSALRRTRPPATGRPSVRWSGASTQPEWCAVLIDGWMTCVNLTDDTALTLRLQSEPGHGVRIEATWSSGSQPVRAQHPGTRVLIVEPGDTLVISGVAAYEVCSQPCESVRGSDAASLGQIG